MNTIRKLRLERNLKQSDLALILNVKQNTISNWETERTEVDRESTLKLADFFGGDRRLSARTGKADDFQHGESRGVP